MTTNELKSYIDRIVGNSLRCILPSYWWKKLFGVVVDKIAEMDSKLSSIEEQQKNVGTWHLCVTINYIDANDLTAAQRKNNQGLFAHLLSAKYLGFFPKFPKEVGVYILEELLPDSACGSVYFPSLIVPQTEGVDPSTGEYIYRFDIYSETHIYTLREDGSVEKTERTDIASGVDELKERLDDLESEINDCVTETEMNRAIAEALTNTLNTEV